MRTPNVRAERPDSSGALDAVGAVGDVGDDTVVSGDIGSANARTRARDRTESTEKGTTASMPADGCVGDDTDGGTAAGAAAAGRVLCFATGDVRGVDARSVDPQS